MAVTQIADATTFVGVEGLASVCIPPVCLIDYARLLAEKLIPDRKR
jgi:hypothetical protein